MMDDHHEHAMNCEAVRVWREDMGEDDETRRRRDAETENTAEAFSFFLRALGNAVEGRPPLVEMGYRAWIMASRYAPAVCPHSARSDLLAMRKLAAECNGHLSLGYLRADLARDVFEFMLGGCATAVSIAKRVTILAYGINTSAAVQSALPSMESIGLLWGLAARNKRSAVSAAAKKILREAKEKTERRDSRHRNVITELWFAKKAVTRARYEAAQMGNRNRRGDKETGSGGDDEKKREVRREVAHLRHGIPVRREFAAMSPEQLKRRLAAMREEAELRRLAGL